VATVSAAHPSPIARDVDDELRFHFQSRIEGADRTRGDAGRGASPDEDEFGDIGK
jgi:hypothetical protein